MSDSIEENPQLQLQREAEPQENGEALTKMAEVESSQEIASSEAPKKPMDFSFSIWPPTQKTRDAVINRLIETLSSPSILSKRYGTVSQEEASEVAKRIEEEAFNSAGANASADDDGIEVLQVYSKEISKRMLDTVKSRSGAAGPESKPSVYSMEISKCMLDTVKSRSAAAAPESKPSAEVKQAAACGEEVSDVKAEP